MPNKPIGFILVYGAGIAGAFELFGPNILTLFKFVFSFAFLFTYGRKDDWNKLFKLWGVLLDDPNKLDFPNNPVFYMLTALAN